MVAYSGSVSTGPKEAKPNAPYTVIMEVSDATVFQISSLFPHYIFFVFIVIVSTIKVLTSTASLKVVVSWSFFRSRTVDVVRDDASDVCERI